MRTFRLPLAVAASVIAFALAGCAADAAPSEWSAEDALTAESPELTAFDALSDDAKFDALFDAEMGDPWADVRPGYQEVPIRIVETLQGEEQRLLLDAYYELRDYSFEWGGETPTVVAVQKNGLTFGYVVSATGRAYGNWGKQELFDRKINPLGSFSYAD